MGCERRHANYFEIDAFNNVDFTAPQGKGYTLDFFVDWQLTPKWQMVMRICYAYSQILWQNTPATQARINATQAALDVVDVTDQFVEEDVIKRASGQFYQSINPADPSDPLGAVPALRQQILDEHYYANVRNEDYSQRLPPQVLINTGYQLYPFMQVSTGWLETEVESFSYIKADFFQHYWLHYEFTSHAYGIGFNSRYFKLGIIADSADLEKAKFLSLNLSGNINF